MSGIDNFEDTNEPVEVLREGKSIDTLPNLTGRFPKLQKLRLILSWNQILEAANHGDMFVIDDTLYITRIGPALEIASLETKFVRDLNDGKATDSPIKRGNTLDAIEEAMKIGPLNEPTGVVWKTLNSVLARIVGANGMKHEDMIEAMVNVSELTSARLNEALETGKPVDILSIFKTASYEIVMEAAIGIDHSSLETEEYFKALTIALGTTVFPTQIGMGSIDNIPVIGKIKAKSIEKLNKFASAVIDLSEQVEGRNLVGVLREAGIEEEKVVGSIHQIIAAGHETTAGTTTAVLYEILKDPTLWDRLEAEIKENNVNFRDFNSVHDLLLKKEGSLLYRVIFEALRMFPPTYLIPSGAAEDIVIGGVRIPAGKEIQVILAAAFRDPEIFLDPNEFDPDRTLPTSPRFTTTQKKALKPFWHGPRKCVGEEMAKFEMAMLIIAIIMNCPRMKIVKEGHISLFTGVTTRKGMTVEPEGYRESLFDLQSEI
jgi:cytochrome P450